MSNTRCIATLIAGFFALVLQATLATAADAAAPSKPGIEPASNDREAVHALDVQAMKGRWFYEVTNPAGAVLRVEKVVDDRQDVVTHYDGQGNIIHSHASIFELSREGRVRLFTFRDTVVTAGPNTGATHAGPQSFVYRIEGDAMIEAWGLLEGDRGAPRLILWQRSKAAN